MGDGGVMSLMFHFILDKLSEYLQIFLNVTSESRSGESTTDGGGADAELEIKLTEKL